jgi:hypothetical protein
MKTWHFSQIGIALVRAVTCPLTGTAMHTSRSEGRHHPSRDPGAAEDTNHEYSCAQHDAHGPDHQQFGPPQANRTGSLCTEATIAAPLAVARPSNTMMSVVIFTILLPPVNAVQKTPFPDFLGAQLRAGVSISAVCGARTTDGSILNARSRRPSLAAKRRARAATDAS